MGSYKIEDAKGRFVMVAANASQETVNAKARELLITCDVRDNTRQTFGGGEYSDNALVRARAARENTSVTVTFANGTYSARWKSS
ncbi:hypothetical protein ANO14919_118230 [Xylariales sp. No.14919]|nr:hypothetical protein ANO14919_118230 [Xylariales sp. No.14919]